MTNKEAIEDFTQYLYYCKKQLDVTKQDDIGNCRDLWSDIQRYKMAINALEEQDKHKWIPVSERLPELGETVMCCNCYGNVFTSCLTYKRPLKQNTQCHDFGQHYGVIAWMPLPEPYVVE